MRVPLHGRIHKDLDALRLDDRSARLTAAQRAQHGHGDPMWDGMAHTCMPQTTPPCWCAVLCCAFAYTAQRLRWSDRDCQISSAGRVADTQYGWKDGPRDRHT